MLESQADAQALRKEEDQRIRTLHEKGYPLRDIARFVSCSEAKVVSVIRSLKSHN
jgi:transposase-like protein